MYHGINWSDIDLLYSKLLLLILSFIIYNLYISTGMSTSACKKKCLKAWNFIHFTTINSQVLQFILISLAGTDVSASWSLMWEEAYLM